MPPCGGAPKLNALSRNPNLSLASSGDMERILKILFCNAGL